MFLREGKVPLVWWDQTSNFGDLLSPWLVRKISKRDVIRATPDEPHYSAIGSILDKTSNNAVVWGSGSFGTEKRKDVPPGAKFLAVRGPLTRNKIDISKKKCPRIYGDPALLVPNYYPRTVDATHELGLIVRWSEPKWRDGFNVNGVKLIDFARGDIESVLDEIHSCKRIISSSLHGLIIADAYGIPNAWLASRSPRGKEFKFFDYFLSVGKLRKPIHFDLLSPDATLEKMIDGIEFNGDPIDIDLNALMNCCPFQS
ncbi:MAG TPA: polysaccharide pyruvyl transferase family protein [Hansschlegelia sp.]